MALPNVTCPYCQQPAKLVDSEIIYGRSYGWIWLCLPCDAYVGVHKNSKDKVPKGALAKRELRELRKQCHAEFDPLWKEGKMTRTEAYGWMAAELGVTEKEAHIAKLSEELCVKLLEKLHGLT